MTTPYHENTNRLPADSMAALHQLVEDHIGDLFTALSIVVLQGDETRLASPCNVFGRALTDVRALAPIRGGETITVAKLG